MSRISMRVTLTPHGLVAWSTTSSSLALMTSRLDSDSSRSIEPITVRMLVCTRAMVASSRLATSYAALAASSTWKNTTPSTRTTALSLVITSWLGTSSTCSIMLILLPTPYTTGIRKCSPGPIVWVYLPKRSTVHS